MNQMRNLARNEHTDFRDIAAPRLLVPALDGSAMQSESGMRSRNRSVRKTERYEADSDVLVIELESAGVGEIYA